MNESGLELKVGTVVGAIDGWWAQVHHFSQLPPEKFAKRGELVVAVGLRVEEASGVDVVAVGREVLGRINEEYYGVLEGSVWERLPSAIEKVAKESLEFNPRDLDVQISGEEVGGAQETDQEEAVIEIKDLSIVAGVYREGVLYVGGWGGGRMWMQRNSQVGQVFSGTEGFWGGSGRVSAGDMVVFGTEKFFLEVGQGVVKVALTSGSVEEAVGILVPVVVGKKQGNGAAAAIVGFEGKEQMPILTEEGMGEVAVSVGTVVEKGLGKRLGAGISGIWEKFREKLSGLGGPFARRGIYVHAYRPPGPGKKGTFVIGIVLLVILLASIIYGVRVKREREVAAGPIGQAQEKISQAKDLAGISPERSRAILGEARAIAETVGDKKVKEGLLLEIQGLSDQVSGVVRSEPTTYLDLKLLRDGISVADSFWDGGVWWGLDRQSGRLVTVETKTKQAKIVAGKDQLGSGQLVAATGGKAYVLNEKGVVEIDPVGNKTRTVVTTDKDWGSITAMGSFGGNLYLLDSGSSIVWRYPVIEGGFGGKQRWFGSGVKPDLSQAVAITIDGSLWIGLKDGRILKFTQGVPDSFEISGLDQSIGELKDVFTTADLPNLYILDVKIGRVLVVSKKGDYVGQYVSPSFQGASGVVVVDEQGKQVLVTVGDKIVQVGQ